MTLHRFLLSAFCFLPLSIFSQPLSLSECYEKTEKNYPLIQQLLAIIPIVSPLNHSAHALGVLEVSKVV
jgi:hypothetical protein